MALALAVRHVLQTSSSQQVVMSAAPLVTPMQVIRVVTRPQAHATPDTTVMLRLMALARAARHVPQVSTKMQAVMALSVYA